MIHHDCRHAVNDIENGLLSKRNAKPTTAGMGYDGRYRCCECGRRVRMDVDEETWATDWQSAPRVEPPYPEGFC